MKSNQPFAAFREQCANVSTAIERELQSQTPPQGDRATHYHCPACEQQREKRSDMRSHMEMCEAYRDYVIASLARKDLQLVS